MIINLAHSPRKPVESSETAIQHDESENPKFRTLPRNDEIPWVLSRMPFREELILRMSLVLGLRPGELFALRWDDVVGYALRLDEATLDGKLYLTLKTKESRGFVALPASLRSGLAEWRKIQNPSSEREFIFPNADGGVYRLDNYRADMLKPALKKVADETGISGIDFRTCRRTCATHLSQYGGVKEVQAHLRHARATTTLDIYILEIPLSVREAVEKLDGILASAPTKLEDLESD
jgi:integrase